MSELQTWLTTFGICIVSGIVPVVSAEVYVVAASVLAPPSLILPLITAATLGQMIGKVVMYYAGSGVVRLPGERMRRMLEEAEGRLSHRPGVEGTVIFVSAAVGLPPFYLVSVACGMLHIPLTRFFLLGTAGRFLRFSVLVLFPQLLKGWVG